MYLNIKKLFNKGEISPKELRKNFGAFTKSNESSKDLSKGAKRQWKRYNDIEFQEKEFKKKLDFFN